MKINIINNKKTKEKENLKEIIKTELSQKIKNIIFEESKTITNIKKNELYIIFLDDSNLLEKLEINYNKNSVIIITTTIKVEYIEKIINYTNTIYYIKTDKNMIVYEIIKKCSEINDKIQIK